jgi:uncharacterized protein
VTTLLLGLVRLYRRWVSPLSPPACRFTPSCSQYAEEALRVHGFVTGLALVVRRLARCHPWGGEGHDPVPPPRPIRKEA